MKSTGSVPVTFNPNVTRGMTSSVFRFLLNCEKVQPMSLRRIFVQSLSSFVWKPSVCVRTPLWNSLTSRAPKTWFQPPLTELSPNRYAPLKNPQRAGAAVISEPYWFDMNVRPITQTVSLVDGRPSTRSTLFMRGFSDVSCREKL